MRHSLTYLLDELISCSMGALTLTVTIIWVIRELQRKACIVCMSSSSWCTLNEWAFYKIVPVFCPFSLWSSKSAGRLKKEKQRVYSKTKSYLEKTIRVIVNLSVLDCWLAKASYLNLICTFDHTASSLYFICKYLCFYCLMCRLIKRSLKKKTIIQIYGQFWNHLEACEEVLTYTWLCILTGIVKLLRTTFSFKCKTETQQRLPTSEILTLTICHHGT